MSNKVLAGSFKDYSVVMDGNNNLYLKKMFDKIPLNAEHVRTVQIIDKSNAKDLQDTLIGGLIGGLIFGPLGMLGGALLSGSSKTYYLELTFVEGGAALLEVEKKYKEALLQLKNPKSLQNIKHRLDQQSPTFREEIMPDDVEVIEDEAEAATEVLDEMTRLRILRENKAITEEEYQLLIKRYEEQ